MGEVRVLLEILDSALSLWDSKEKTKYIDKKIKLEKKYYEEFNKPVWEPGQTTKGKRLDSELGAIKLELRILCSNAATAIRASNTKS